MIDIHHHLLFGLDDGSPDIATSVAMARLAVADGITHVVCTPHANGQFPYRPETNAERLEQLRAVLAQEKIPLTLGMGCDFHLSYENLEALKVHPARFTINAHDYLLVEPPDYGLPIGLSETFYHLQLAGLTPVLTHPERNPTLQSDTLRLANWLRGGLLIQVTADSVLGHMGKAPERMSHHLLAMRWVHFIATDAHNLTSRPPRMREAHKLIAKKYGADLADLLCIENPRAAFEGKPLPEQHEPQHLHDDMEPPSWWRRLFGR